jgi:glutaredoxin-related protein
MPFTPHPDLSEAEVAETVESTIAEHDVAIFMKGNRTFPQCGYSQRAVQLIGQYTDAFADVDTLAALDAFRSALAAHSGWETIPQVYVDGEFIGGSDIIAELEERGELAPLLAD